MKIKKIIRIIIVCILLVAAIYTFRNIDIKKYPIVIKFLKSFFEQFGEATSIMVFITIFSLRSLLVIFPIFIFSVISGALYGTVLGLVVSLIGGLISASIAYGLGRYVTGDIIEKHFSKMSKFLKSSEITHFKLVLYLRLITIIPFDIFGYVAGASKVKFKEFLLGTFLGSMPEFFIYSYMGSKGVTGLLKHRALVAEHDVIILSLIVLILLSFLKKKIYNKLFY